MSPPLKRSLPCGLMLLVAATAALAGGLEVENARLRLLPGDVPAGGYFSLANAGAKSAVLVGAESPAFERVTMHETIQQGGTSRMEPVPRLELAPGERIDFAPGGYHLMGMERKQPLAVGDDVTIELLFEDGQRLPAVFRAVSPATQFQ